MRVESRRLYAKIASKVNQGRNQEEDFERELKECDALLAKFKDRQTDDVANLLLTKARLYHEVFADSARAAELLHLLKRDFPSTQPAQSADRMLAAITRAKAGADIQRSLVAGSVFPGFEEKDLTGKPLSLAALRGKVVLVDFWATWCRPCVAELPSVARTYRRYQDAGFEIVGLSLDEDRSKLEGFLKQNNVTWPQYFDGQGWENKLARKYGVQSIPATFLLDREGKIIAKDLRGAELEAAVAKAVQTK